MTDWIFELSFAEVCLHKKDIFIYTSCFCLSLHLQTFFHSRCSYIGRCFRVFQILLKITPTTGFQRLCAIFGDQKNVYHVIHWPGSFGPGCGGGGGFLNPKNLKFERFHILKNSWKWRIEFLNFPLLKSVCTRKTYLSIYVLFLFVFIFENIFPFLMFLSKTMFFPSKFYVVSKQKSRLSVCVCVRACMCVSNKQTNTTRWDVLHHPKKVLGWTAAGKKHVNWLQFLHFVNRCNWCMFLVY